MPLHGISFPDSVINNMVCYQGCRPAKLFANAAALFLMQVSGKSSVRLPFLLTLFGFVPKNALTKTGENRKINKTDMQNAIIEGGLECILNRGFEGTE